MIDQPTRRVRVQAIIAETPTVKRFVLVPCDGSPLAGFSAGSHVTTFLETSQGVIERHYSLCSDPADKSAYEIAVRLTPESRGGSRFLHEAISVGDTLTISQPKNHFSLSHRATHHVLVAGGIGITPLYSMAIELERRGCSYELHYAARSLEDCALYEGVAGLGAKVRFYFSEGEHPRRLKPELVLQNQRVGTHVYLCGPASLITEFREAAFAYGYPVGNVHFEKFEALRFEEDRPFLVRLARTGRTVEIERKESLLDGLARHGVHVHHSCKIGGCGACEVAVCQGEVEHRDFVLSDAERAANRTMISCVSRAKGDWMELDL